MIQTSIISQTEKYVRSILEDDFTGHDWHHIDRVRCLALQIAKEESVDCFVVELAALLHDIGDWKFHDGDENMGPKLSRAWLEKLEVEENIIQHVCDIISQLSFKGAGVKTPMTTKEGMCVQDADRLDAIGAIGISRAFAYGGYHHQPIYDPQNTPQAHQSFEEYKLAKTTSINHFYEKLLLLKDLMNTEAAKQLAQPRHELMENFLTHFHTDWKP